MWSRQGDGWLLLIRRLAPFLTCEQGTASGAANGSVVAAAVVAQNGQVIAAAATAAVMVAVAGAAAA